LTIYESIVGAAKSPFQTNIDDQPFNCTGNFPIAFALGAGSESRVSMGIAVIGGLIFSTILTLFVIPAIYVYLTSKKGRRSDFNHLKNY
jgi:multidrug efflux pump